MKTPATGEIENGKQKGQSTTVAAVVVAALKGVMEVQRGKAYF
jgi:hypothetical protein